MRFGFLTLLFVTITAAQDVGVGVKGGFPFSEVFHATGSIGFQPFRASTQRFTVGPMLQIRLPLAFGAEFDALYKRFDQSGGSIHLGSTVEKTGSSWEFPLLGTYRFGKSLAAPYIEAGVSFNHLSGYLESFRTLPSPPSSQPEGSATRTGVAVGAGLELKLFLLRVAPGLRFSHWGDTLFIPATNNADFLVGVSF